MIAFLENNGTFIYPLLPVDKQSFFYTVKYIYMISEIQLKRKILVYIMYNLILFFNLCTFFNVGIKDEGILRVPGSAARIRVTACFHVDFLIPRT